LIQSQPGSPLAKYISENMLLYVEVILCNCGGNISDNEAAAINLLNNTYIDFVTKERYIELLSTNITEIKQISDTTLWTPMLSRGIIVFSVTNFINYFLQHGVDSALSKYINNENAEFDFKTTVNDFGEDTSARLFNAVAICNDIETPKYRNILLDLEYYFDSYDADEISDEKFVVLINDGILQMDAEGLKFVREKYNKHILSFINQNLDKYLALQAANTFRLDEVLQIILWNIDDKKKIDLLAWTATDDIISINGKGYSDTVNAYIITNNLNPEDKPYLYANYLQFGEVTRAAIVTLAIEGVREILYNDMVIDDRLLSSLLQTNKLPHNQKIELFTMAIPKLNEDTCKIHFDELGLSELKGIFARSGRRNYEKSPDVSAVLEALKQNDWIYEYRDDERNPNKYVVVKNKPHSKGIDMLD
jgi:hypothetical protein